ncbi:MAG: hypothetical protein E7471_00305 [Ruminococcaceae bacterium]|nr:hypothetical protein [Oscillospiraceae bacterium]
MKKIRVMIGLLCAVVLLVSFGLVDYILNLKSADDFLPETEPAETIPQNTTLKEPPTLTVGCGLKEANALRGTTSWTYQNADGTVTGIEADGMHPLQAKKHMPSIPLKNRTIESRLDAHLFWSISPDDVAVRCWHETDWGEPGAESEEIPVNILMVDSNIETAPIFCIPLKNGNYIYEIIAEWNRETYHGRTHYSFYTVQPSSVK